MYFSIPTHTHVPTHTPFVHRARLDTLAYTVLVHTFIYPHLTFATFTSLAQDVIRCITLPGLKLVMVGYLFVVTFIIYATFGLQSFEHLFTYGVDDEMPDGCHSVISCFW